MYYRISKNEKILFFGKKIAQVWAVTLIGCLGRANVRAFHVNPNSIHTESTFINP